MPFRSTFRWWWLPLLGVYALVFAELFIRLLDPVLVSPRYVVASEYGVRANWPDIRYRHFGPEYEIDFEINAAGMRAPVEYALAKPPNTLRILALGDSFTMGYGAAVDETYLAVLQEQLQQSTGCNVEVLNVGVSGHGTAEELLTMRYFAPRYDPDVVLLQWHHTDLRENVRSRLFKLDEQQRLLRDRETYLPQVGVREKLFRNPVYRFIAGNSMFYTLLRNKAANFGKKNLLQAGLDDGIVPLPPELVGAGEGVNTAYLRSRRLSRALLQAFVTEVQGSGAEALILDVPTRLENSQSRFRSTIIPSPGVDHLVYSPIDDFQEHSGQLLFWEHSAGHFTPLGNRVVGTGLAKRVLSRCR